MNDNKYIYNKDAIKKVRREILQAIFLPVFAILLFFIFVYFGLNDNRNPVFITIMVVSIPVAFFGVLIKSLDAFGKTIDYISKH